MLKSATVSTFHIDDPDAAIRELRAALDGKLTLMAHSLGVILCDPEYIMTGTLAAICRAFPFPTVGMTTTSQSVGGQSGILMLTMMVLTSDQATFTVGQTAELTPGDIIQKTRAACARHEEEPALVLAFPPLIQGVSGDRYVEAFENVYGDVPVFGAIALDDTFSHEDCASFADGHAAHRAMSYALVSGVSPRFILGTITGEHITPHSGQITRSNANVVQEINDMPAAEYFENIGLAKDGVLRNGVQFVPFMLDIRKLSVYDGVPVVRTLASFDENGYAVCSGYMYQGSVFTIGVCDRGSVFSSTSDAVARLSALPDINAVLMFSCIVRRTAYGTDTMGELRVVEQGMPSVPFMLGYADGEICPTSVRDARAANRFHNYSFIACIL